MMKVGKKYKVGSGHPTQEPEHRFSTVLVQVTYKLLCLRV